MLYGESIGRETLDLTVAKTDRFADNVKNLNKI